MLNDRNINEKQAAAYRNLWWAVIRGAVQDLSRATREQSARNFLFQDEVWFPLVCEFSGTTPEYIRTGVRRAKRIPPVRQNRRTNSARKNGRNP